MGIIYLEARKKITPPRIIHGELLILAILDLIFLAAWVNMWLLEK